MDFKAPRNTDEKSWKTIGAILRSGHIFYRGFPVPGKCAVGSLRQKEKLDVPHVESQSAKKSIFQIPKRKRMRNRLTNRSTWAGNV